MSLQSAAARFTKTFKTVGGARFSGQIYIPATNAPTDNFELPRRMMRTSPKAPLNAGDVFVTMGRHYMVSLNTDSDHDNLRYRTFRLFEVDKQLVWSRYQTETDPVTQIEKNTAPQDLGSIYVALEPKSPAQDTLKVPAPRFRIVTNVDLKLGDILDGTLEVERVWKQLGVTFGEAS